MRTLLAILVVAASGAFAQDLTKECAGCHGANGEGNDAKGIPRIAGQPVSYLARQLEAYATGARKNPVMSPIVKSLTPEQRKSLAQHYAGIAPKSSAAKASQQNARGRTLAIVGDNNQRIQACQNCHGPGGVGQAPDTPYLAGLGPNYLAAALQEWKSGTRKTDPSRQMNHIGQSLNDADMKALAAYFSALPAPAQGAAFAQARTRQAPSGQANQSAPGQAEPTQGIGVEGGAATSGGDQGPGGGGAASGSGPSGSRTGGTP